ncbi:uncharacterized protein VTP21DRAFT_7816 [Calcarisporiella thermophila]|uniref:uncharacterized protein n=1 Tax=Calcarisporiella thermophila TaxID=911321 RepID=UPI003742646B
MNIARPVGSEISSVSFSLYDSEEIKKISVKQIINPVIFDNLMHPTKGGLYDPALGPFSKSHVCATCTLDHFSCPGHFGHIELPTPVYNPLFFNQMFSLLRSTCWNCHHFRMSRPELHRYISKLILLDRGLVVEANRIDGIPISAEKMKQRGEEMELDAEDEAEEEGMDGENYIRKLDAFVKHAIKNNASSDMSYKVTVVTDERKKVISEFMKRALAKKKCENCKAPAYALRKDGFVKIFQLPLNKKQRLYVEALGMKERNVLLTNSKLSSRRNNEDIMDIDEEIEGSADDNEETVEVAHKENSIDIDEDVTESSKYLTSMHVKGHLKLLFENENQMTTLMFGARSPVGKSKPKLASADAFFLEILPVSPTRFRPPSVMNDKMFENPQNELLSKILSLCEEIRNTNSLLSKRSESNGEEKQVDEGVVYKSLIDAFIRLQQEVNGYIDSSKNTTTPRGRNPPTGIRQVLEKKEGLFRKHMMGKRVNYAARSVISPDPNIETNEIGIPPVFAKKLTYPEPVTSFNVKELRKAIINGPDVWPGATHVQHEDGSLTTLTHLSLESRIALAHQLLTPQSVSGSSSSALYPTATSAINKKVYRHIRNGDMLLVNRQPTLHKPSIMAHRARILPGEKTIRMHYANCNTYNADFDGDEMNLHFPQNEIARAEAKLIANTDSQYLVPTSGSPLRGLIQDHVDAGVWMTSKDTFFTREEYQQLIYGALRPEDPDYIGSRTILTVESAILKPRPLWTGKQVLTTILLNLTVNHIPLNMRSKAKVDGKFWPGHPEEGTVIFYQGELLTGVLDKSQFGASKFGLVHSCYELYSAELAGQLLSILGRLFTKYLQHSGFSCRMDDLLFTEDGNNVRDKIFKESEKESYETALEYVGLKDMAKTASPSDLKAEFNRRLEGVLRDPDLHENYDMAMMQTVNQIQSKVIKETLPSGLQVKFPHNNMQMMVTAGAKGSSVNVSQISCCLGQQALEGRRVPVMVSGKTLPSFLPNDTSGRAGGFISGRFLTGIKPQEYYFHCMAGRVGLIDTAVKTSRSGYLQRCLIKHLEGLKVNYDYTVRDADGSVLQFNYGEDSLDVTKQAHLYEFDFSAQNCKAIASKYKLASMLESDMVNTKDAYSYSKKALKKPHKYDPVLSQFNPSRNIGSVSEKFHAALEKYIKTNPGRLLRSDEDKENNDPASLRKREIDRCANRGDLAPKSFRSLMHVKYMKSMADPGEAVGLLAAQSVGEPSTQMTLNTFHLAGAGGNVTLGIPRLREIIMTASAQIKTPRMTLPLHEHITEEQAKNFCKDVSRLTIADLMDEVVVTERMSARQAKTGHRRVRIYSVRLNMFPREEYSEEYNVTSDVVQDTIERRFVKQLEQAIVRDLRKAQRKSKAGGDDEGHEIGKGKPVNESSSGFLEDEDDNRAVTSRKDDSEDEGDATSAKIAARSKQYASYDAPDEEDEEIIRSVDKRLAQEERELEGEEGDSETDSDEEMDEEARLAKAEKLQADRAERIISSSNYIKAYRFDEMHGAWCEIELHFPADTRKILMLALVEQVCHRTVIREVPGISRCHIAPPKNESDTQRNILAEGTNLRGMWELDNVLDVNRIYTNDIAAILRTYGVEAARNAIVREITEVFDAYHISVDHRHLSIIADYMTFEGGYKPFNRMGIESNVSPFLKMSFETTCHFLTQATLYGDYDTLDSPSARIVMGKPVPGGTGSFDILVDLENRY